jgi:hypothetical protein
MLFAVLFISYGSAKAFTIPTGNDDWTLRLDNTVRYTLMYRVSGQNDAILANPNADDGDRNFDRGFVSNRVDLLTEMDLIYRPKSMGIRVSGSFWYDEVYGGPFDNTSPETSNYLRNGQQEIGLYKFYDRYYRGPYGELLDAFAFAKFTPGDMPLYIKVGRHVYSWGQSLLNPFHGISYGQMPLDLAKAQALPGVEVKELFRPLGSVSAIAQVNSEFQIAGQWFFEWERNLLPGPGTYFGASDVSIDGAGALILGPGLFVMHGRDIEAEKNRDFGIAFQYNPKWMADTTFGLYYRRFSDKMPTLILNSNGSANPNDWMYHAAYKSDIDLFGLSLATDIKGISVGAEVNYRRDMPLNGELPFVNSDAELPSKGDILGPEGETLHALVNILGLLKKTALWDAGSYMAEICYSRWMTVSEHEELFKGRDGYNAFDRVTRDAGHIAAIFSPQYLHVLPGLDVTVPISIAYGIWGVSPVAAGNGEGDGNWSIGLNFDYLTKYKLNFVYSNFFGDIENGASRGNYAMMKDRDFVSLTFKVSF